MKNFLKSDFFPLGTMFVALLVGFWLGFQVSQSYSVPNNSEEWIVLKITLDTDDQNFYQITAGGRIRWTLSDFGKLSKTLKPKESAKVHRSMLSMLRVKEY